MKVKVRFQEEYILAHILKSGVFGAGLGESKLCEVSFAFFFFPRVITQSSRLEVLSRDCCQIPLWKALCSLRLSGLEWPVILLLGESLV